MSNERVVCASCGSNNFATQAACWKCGKTLAALPSGLSAPSQAGTVAAMPLRTESPMALWSALAMGLLFPAVALPVGLVFLMLDDQRKIQIGWWNILFGLLGTVLNGILVAITLGPLVAGLSRLVPSLMGPTAARSENLNSEAAPLDLPGQRPFASPPR